MAQIILQSESERSHALLSPSSAKRWMNCPGSVWLCKTLPPEPPSFAAQEGTAAHLLAEKALSARGIAPLLKVGAIELSDKTLIEVTDEMRDAVGLYHDTVLAAGDNPLVEQPFSIIEGLLYGTADAVVETKEKLYVFDFKYGAGVEVEAVWNEQEMIYALGVILQHPNLPADFPVELVIVQPRHFKDEKVKRFLLTVGDILSWMDFELLPAVERASKPNSVYIPGKAQCQWCPAASICPALKRNALAFAETAPVELDSFPSDVAQFSPEQLAKAIDLEASFAKWVKSVQAKFDAVSERAKSLMETGMTVPGYKLVEGRARNKWADEGLVPSIISPEVEAYDAVLKSPAKMKAAYKELGLDGKDLDQYIVTERGVEIAPESSKKQAICVSPEAVFAGVKGEQQ